MKLTTLQIVFLAYIAVMTLVGLVSMGADKRRAIKHRWRIPERTLFVIALLGGSLGSFIGMWLFRHKTRHWYFVVFIPVILAVHIALSVLILR